MSQLLNKRKRKQFIITQQTSHHFFTTPWSDPCSPLPPFYFHIRAPARIVSGIGTSCIVIYTTFNVEEFRQTKLPPSPYFNVINFTITTLENPHRLLDLTPQLLLFCLLYLCFDIIKKVILGISQFVFQICSAFMAVHWVGVAYNCSSE